VGVTHANNDKKDEQIVEKMDEDKVEKEEQPTNEEANQDKVMEKVEDTKETEQEQETQQEVEMKDKTAIVDADADVVTKEVIRSDDVNDVAKETEEIKVNATTKGDEWMKYKQHVLAISFLLCLWFQFI